MQKISYIRFGTDYPELSDGEGRIHLAAITDYELRIALFIMPKL